MSKHTVGPFSTDGDKSSSTGKIRILAPEKETGWCTVLASINIKNTNPEEAEANAALFAAAPEMLDVLKRWSTAVSGFGESVPMGEILQVIAKAEGPIGDGR